MSTNLQMSALELFTTEAISVSLLPRDVAFALGE